MDARLAIAASGTRQRRWHRGSSDDIQPMVHIDPETDGGGRPVTQLPAVATSSSMPDPARLSRALDSRLGSLGQDLRPDAALTDRRQAERRLRALAVLIESETVTISDRDSERVLRRLAQLYGNGCTAHRGDIYTGTAAGYAAVVAALSQKCPGLDFSEAIGQLLELMIRLFRQEDIAWAAVYRHLRSIPDGVRAKQQLKRVCAADIREWFEAGVQNLFGLRAELRERIRELAEAADALAQEIQAREDSIRPANAKGARNRKVVVLADWFKERRLTELRHERQAITDETTDKVDTVALINMDIREFEQRLVEARRAYLLCLV